MTSLPADAPRPRRCVVRKRTPEGEYGFNLHAEKSKGQFIGAIDSNSPAEEAGLRPGDRIVAVNGASVANEPHKVVVAKIKEDPSSCDLIVVDEETHSWYAEHKVQIPIDPDFVHTRIQEPDRTSSHRIEEPANHTNGNADSTTVEYPLQPPVQQPITEYRSSSASAAPRPPSYQEAMGKQSTGSSLRPRLCKLVKPDETAEFGFNLHADKNTGHFIGKVDPESIGQHAGLEQGQRIVGVNGVLIYPHTAHKDVVSLIRGNPLCAELLVASPEVDSWYKNNNMEYDFATAEHTSSTPSHVEVADGAAVSKGVADINISNGSSANGDSGIDHEVHQEVTLGDYSQSKGSPELYESIQDNTSPRNEQQYQPDWMQLSAAELRERVGQHKKADPRTQRLSLQEKHELIRNM